MSDTIKIYINQTQPVKAITVAPTGARGADGAAGTNGTNGGSTNAWDYKAKTNATSGYPGNGYLLWNNATQTSATSILVSHLTDDDTDIELFLSFFVINQKIFIQNRDDSSQNQVWQITGTPTVTGANTSTAYYTFPVTLVSSAGAAFSNNHSILFGQIVVATNAVTSATTSDGTASLYIADLRVALSGSIRLQGAASSVYLRAGNPTDVRDIDFPNESGTVALTASTTGVPDKLTNGTIAGTLTINSTTINYGTGAASAHRTALGLTTLATTTAGTGVVTALGNAANGAGGFVTDSGTVANATNAGYATIAGNATSANEVPLSGVTGLGTGVATALAINVGSAGAFITFNGALGTPSSGTLTSCTGLPISTGVSGLGTGVATFLATPSSANLLAAVTDETGSGSLVFATSPTITTPTIAQINGGIAANDDLTLQGTTNATRTTSYVNLQPSGGNVGIGTATPSATLHAIALTEQMRIGYDAANYTSLTVTSAGNVTRNNTGTFVSQTLNGSQALYQGFSSSAVYMTIGGTTRGDGSLGKFNIFGIGTASDAPVQTIWHTTDDSAGKNAGLITKTRMTNRYLKTYQTIGQNDNSFSNAGLIQFTAFEYSNNTYTTLATPTEFSGWNYQYYNGAAYESLLAVRKAGVGVGVVSPNAKAKLQVDSTTQGFLPPRMTTTQRDAITSVPAGLMIYNTTTNKLNVYTTAWEIITSL